MKKMLVLTAVIALAFSGIATAQIDPDPDGMSVYFDEDGVSFCMAVEPGTIAQGTAYFLLTNPSTTAVNVLGWAANLNFVINEPFAPVQWNLLDGLNAGSGMDFIVGNGNSPLPIVDGVCVLASAAFAFFGAVDPYAIFEVNGSDFVSYPEGVGYTATIGIGTPGQPKLGAWGPCAWVNDCPLDPIANEDMSWSQVKSLY